MLTPWGGTQVYSSDVDWENAFGRRFDLKALNQFKKEILDPTLNLRVNILATDVAIADRYWRLTATEASHEVENFTKPNRFVAGEA